MIRYVNEQCSPKVQSCLLRLLGIRTPARDGALLSQGLGFGLNPGPDCSMRYSHTRRSRTYQHHPVCVSFLVTSHPQYLGTARPRTRNIREMHRKKMWQLESWINGSQQPSPRSLHYYCCSNLQGGPFDNLSTFSQIQ